MLLAAVWTAGCGGSGTTGAAQTVVRAADSAAVTGVQIVQQTSRQVQNIPKLVFDMAEGLLTANKTTSWGPPEMVLVHDLVYVIVYPTPAAERQRTGTPRMVLIPRNSFTDPTAF
jgi:hypothetical protein